MHEQKKKKKKEHNHGNMQIKLTDKKKILFEICCSSRNILLQHLERHIAKHMAQVLLVIKLVNHVGITWFLS